MVSVIFGLISAVFAALTTILAKKGLKNVKSNLATALRTIVVLIFAWVVVLISKSDFSGVEQDWYWLILSGLSTGFSWLCFYRALELGNVNKVVPVDKCSTVLTMALAFVFLNESATFWKIFGMVVMLGGTFMMLEKKENANKDEKASWLLYAIGSCVFASLTSVFAKVGLVHTNANTAMALRTCIVLLMSWLVVFTTKQHDGLKTINKNDIMYLVLSGAATGFSWMFYFWALQMGQASVIAPIDKLSVLFTVILSWILFKEKLGKKGIAGLALLVLGTLLIAMESLLPKIWF